MSQCYKCTKVIENVSEINSCVKCDICTEMFHFDCTDITKRFFEKLIPYKSIRWRCEECVNLDKNDLKYMKQVIARLKSIEIIVKSNEKALLNQKTEIDKIKKMAISEKTTTSANLLHSGSKTTPVTSNINKRKWSDLLTDTQADTPHTNNTDMSNSAKRPKPSVINPKKHDPILIVKPRNADDAASIKNIIKATINPESDPVKKMQLTSRGDFIVHCNDSNALSTIKNKLTQKIGDTGEVKEPATAKPRLKVVGFDSDYFDDDTRLISAIRKQNDKLFDETSEIQIADKKKMRGKDLHTAVLTVDVNTFKRVLTAGKIFIGWNSCKIYEHIEVMRCFKCNQFGHLARECKEEEFVCPLCADKHSMNLCRVKEDGYKCANCIRANTELKLDVDYKHCAFSLKCPVLSKQIEKRKRHIRYDI